MLTNDSEEMTWHYMVSHETTTFLKEHLMEVSDVYRIYVCGIDGLAAIVNLKMQHFECRSCHNTMQVSQIRIPYACKLLCQEYLPHHLCHQIIALFWMANSHAFHIHCGVNASNPVEPPIRCTFDDA